VAEIRSSVQAAYLKMYLQILTAIILFSTWPAFAQSIYQPTSHEIYPYLKRMESRGLLPEYRDAAKPLSRKVLASHLKNLDSGLDRMTEVERDEYEFLKEEFSYELGLLAGDQQPSEIRWHVISETFPGGMINLEPNLQFSFSKIGDNNARLRAQGAKTYGYVFHDVGYYFNFVDYREVGKAVNFTKTHTQAPGIVLTKRIEDQIEYNTTEAQLTFDIGPLNVSLEKMQNSWGVSRYGNIAFSEKAPSYPQVKLRVPVTSWMDFIYLHAELNSGILDSSRSYHTSSSSMTDFYRAVDRLKYMAAHMIEVTPVRGVDFSLGESVVYSDRGPLLIYMIPVMFFKSGEHYNGDKDNVQWFANLDLNLIRNVNVYGSLFIDELNIDDLFDPEKQRNQLGYTLGFQIYDLPFRNLEILAEYTRLNPWVYTHKQPATTFTSNGYVLGNWMGQNADNLYCELTYRPMRSLLLGATYEIYRKGGEKDIAFQYRLPSQAFLYGPLHQERSYGAYARYQFFRDCFVDANIRSRSTSDEAAKLRNDRKLEYSISVRYGLW
jgi:hypothetical protein